MAITEFHVTDRRNFNSQGQAQLQDSISQGQPLVLRGETITFPPAFDSQSLTAPACCAGALTWPALSRWKGSQGLHRLTALAGSARVEVMTSETDTFHGELRRHSPTTCTFAEFLQAAALSPDSPRGAATASPAAPAGGGSDDTGWPAGPQAQAGSAGACPRAASGLQTVKPKLGPGKAGQPAAHSESGSKTAALPQPSLPAKDASPEKGRGDARPGRRRPARASAELPGPRKRAKTRHISGFGASQLEQEPWGDSARNARSVIQQAAERSATQSSQRDHHLHNDSGSSSSGSTLATDRSPQTAAADDQAAPDGPIAAADVKQAPGGQQPRLGPHLYLAQATIPRCSRVADEAPGLSGLWQDFSVPRALEAVQVSQTNLWMSRRWEPKPLREQQAALPGAWGVALL